ncbi:hypothetical protein [Streptomyces sp. NPDC020141]|uniref:phage terminase small subunit n=1 Tax=Streptomyces sp. NPDC020141 TaxID=3365065 RepID=UPI00379AC0E2
MTTVVSDDELRGPELPDGILPDDGEWHPRTLQWWQTWRESPQAMAFIDTDWDFLLDTALLHHVMWTKGRWEFASEVRLRAAKYGATPEDRARLKLKVEDPANASQKAAQRPANVSDINSRRARLTG